MIRPTRPVPQCRRAQRTTTSSPPTNLRSSNLRRSSCRSLNRILHFRSGGPVSLRFSIVDSSSSHPSIPISGLKGRRDLSFCNDFNWPRPKTALIATLSQPLFSVALKWQRRLTNFLVSREPPTVVCPGGGGDGERSHGFKLNYGVILSYARMTASLNIGPARDGYRERAERLARISADRN